jgi:hypothetical protein
MIFCHGRIRAGLPLGVNEKSTRRKLLNEGVRNDQKKARVSLFGFESRPRLVLSSKKAVGEIIEPVE